MPKWISVEVTKGDEPPEPPRPRPDDEDAPAPEASSGSAATWLAGLIATLMVLVLAGVGWYFGIRPAQQQASGASGANPPAGVGVPAPMDDLPAVVALVNGEPITREQLTQVIRINQALYPFTSGGSEYVMDPQTLTNLRNTLLEQMINNRFELKGAQAAGVTVTDAELDTEFQNFIAIYRADAAQLDAALTRYGLTTAQLKGWLRDSLVINRFLSLKAQESAQKGQPFSRESWLNDQLITAEIQINLPSARNTTPLRVGEPPPDFTLRDIDGNTWVLSQLRGRPVVVNFWATWCAPCKFEMPLFESAYRKYKDQGLLILAVDIKTDNGLEAVKRYAKDLSLTFPIPMDTTGEVEQLYRVRAYPTTYFVGRDGKLREIKRGAFINADQLLASVDKIMAQ